MEDAESQLGPDASGREGSLVVVATPLGNLGDLSSRALAILGEADVVFCEDTRRSRTLFAAHGLHPRTRLRSLHQHNEAAQCEEVVARVRAGQTVALVSDAGTPGISDPGERVVAAVAAAGLRVSTAPGPSAVVAALSISGLATERFVMEGFVPRRAGERLARLEQWDRETRTVVFYESPVRLVATLEQMARRWPDRAVCVVRELTKVHEEVLRGTVAEVHQALARREVIGEVVVVLAGATTAVDVDEDVVRAALGELIDAGTSVRDAVSSVATRLGVAHRRVYRIALERRVGEW
ncbi:MAG: 16S rRNA (cytidine(1402)-2'-O)-methyltransferase [Acidimicrobiales bacterium]